jgi:hypothetical protein
MAGRVKARARPGGPPRQISRGPPDGARRTFMTGHNAGSSSVIEEEDNRRPLESALENILVDFGLIGVFRSQSVVRQQGYLLWIASADPQGLRDERIAGMLDDLALSEKIGDDGAWDVDFSIPGSTYRQEG